jgi:gamma-glutamylcyclotransferase (GGCT)/AIG2-like uncharacterized protein YtfP
MATNPFQHMYFGFEYETLPQIKKDSTFLKKLEESWGSFNAPYKTCKRQARIDAAQRLSRFMLAESIQKALESNPPPSQSPKKHIFTYTPEYGDDACFVNEDNEENIDNNYKWVIEYDSSVKMKQQTAVKPPRLFYKSLSEWMSYNITNCEDFAKYINPDTPTRTNNKGIVMQNIEIVSPKLPVSVDTLNHVKQIMPMFSLNNTITYLNNSTTSNHLHFSYEVGNDKLFREPKHLYNLCMAWLYFEPMIMHLFPWWRRFNIYARPMRSIMLEAMDNDTDKLCRMFLYGTYDEWIGHLKQGKNKKLKAIVEKDMSTLDENDKYRLLNAVITLFQGDPTVRENRYAGLNLLNLVKGGIGTVEVRLKHGSSDPHELGWFVLFFATFFKTVVELTNKDISVVELLKDAGYKDFLWTAWHDQDLKKWGVLNILFDNVLASQTQNDGSLADLVSNPMDFNKNYNARVEHITKIDLNMLYDFCVSQFHKTDTDKLKGLLIKKRGEINEGNKNPAMIDQDHDMVGGGNIQQRYSIFSYGSNSAKQLAERTGARCLTPYPAYLDNWTRVFAGYSKFREGGVASVYPLKGARVYGCVFELTKQELDILDRYEPGYTRSSKYIQIRTPDGEIKRIRCFIYIRDDQKFTHPPSIDYMRAIRTMLDDANPSKKSKIQIRGLVMQDKRKKPVLMSFGYYFRDKITLFKRPFEVTEIDPNGSTHTFENKRRRKTPPRSGKMQS